MDNTTKLEVKKVARILQSTDKNIADIARGAAFLAADGNFDLDTAIDLAARVMELHKRGKAMLTYEERICTLANMAESSSWDDVLAMDDDSLVTALDESGVSGLGIVIDNYYGG